MEKLRIIVGGFIGIMPAGGVTWDYVQYPLGFSLMGHDVYYIEDTRLYPVYQQSVSAWDDCSSCVEYLQKVMDYFGMKDRWAYRDEASGKCFGLTEIQLKEICRTADVFVNVSCSTFLRDEYLKIPARVLIDSDPMFTQIQCSSEQKFTPGEPSALQMVKAHNHLFTFGENIGAADCQIPDCSLNWYTTRQPICLDYWKTGPVADSTTASFTTLMNWTAGKPLYYNGTTWGQKDIEFKKFLYVPQLVNGMQFSAVVNQTGGTEPTFFKEDIEKAGWKILDSKSNAGNWVQYQQFIDHSFGEFTVAKETYVKANTGWFSCRSACYLASGKPVVTQDTGWSKFLPSDLGLLSFTDINGAAEALISVVREPGKHAKAARGIAEDFFESKKVLKSLLTKLN